MGQTGQPKWVALKRITKIHKKLLNIDLPLTNVREEFNCWLHDHTFAQSDLSMADAEMKTVTVYKRRSKKRKRAKSSARQGRLPAWAGGVILKGPVPTSKIVTMRYFDQIALSPGTTAASEYHFRMASIFDPDASGTGHQPLGHDQWASFYGHYEVVESVITVWYIPQTDAGVGCTLRLATSSTAFTTPERICEAPLTVKTFAGRGRGSPAKLTLTYIPKQLHGRDYDSGNGSANFGANPTYVSVAHVGGFSAANSGTAPTIDCQVQIDYKVRLTSPLPLNVS